MFIVGWCLSFLVFTGLMVIPNLGPSWLGWHPLLTKMTAAAVPVWLLILGNLSSYVSLFLPAKLSKYLWLPSGAFLAGFIAWFARTGFFLGKTNGQLLVLLVVIAVCALACLLPYRPSNQAGNGLEPASLLTCGLGTLLIGLMFLWPTFSAAGIGAAPPSIKWRELAVPGQASRTQEVVTLLSVECPTCRTKYPNVNTQVRLIPLKPTPQSKELCLLAMIAEVKLNQTQRNRLWSLSDPAVMLPLFEKEVQPTTEELAAAEAELKKTRSIVRSLQVSTVPTIILCATSENCTAASLE